MENDNKNIKKSISVHPLNKNKKALGSRGVGYNSSKVLLSEEERNFVDFYFDLIVSESESSFLFNCFYEAPSNKGFGELIKKLERLNFEDNKKVFLKEKIDFLYVLDFLEKNFSGYRSSGFASFFVRDFLLKTKILNNEDRQYFLGRAESTDFYSLLYESLVGHKKSNFLLFVIEKIYLNFDEWKNVPSYRLTEKIEKFHFDNVSEIKKYNFRVVADLFGLSYDYLKSSVVVDKNKLGSGSNDLIVCAIENVIFENDVLFSFFEKNNRKLDDVLILFPEKFIFVLMCFSCSNIYDVVKEALSLSYNEVKNKFRF